MWTECVLVGLWSVCWSSWTDWLTQTDCTFEEQLNGHPTTTATAAADGERESERARDPVLRSFGYCPSVRARERASEGRAARIRSIDGRTDDGKRRTRHRQRRRLAIAVRPFLPSIPPPARSSRSPRRRRRRRRRPLYFTSPLFSAESARSPCSVRWPSASLPSWANCTYYIPIAESIRSSVSSVLAVRSTVERGSGSAGHAHEIGGDDDDGAATLIAQK